MDDLTFWLSRHHVAEVGSEEVRRRDPDDRNFAVTDDRKVSKIATKSNDEPSTMRFSRDAVAYVGLLSLGSQSNLQCRDFGQNQASTIADGWHFRNIAQLRLNTQMDLL